MNTAGVLDDYLEQLLGDAVPAPADAPALVATLDAGTTPGVDADAVVTDTMPAAVLDGLLDEVRNDPSLSGAMTLAEDEQRPSWDDLPAEVVYETGPVVAPAAAPAPGFEDLLDEVRNDPSLSGLMTVDADVAPSAPAPPPAPAPKPEPAPAAPPAPAARAMPAMPLAPSIRAKTPTLAQSRPGSWEELQRQARDPASSPRENRRASERTSRWLRLRCGVQAYALELLKVQEVVLPVPLLPLRGTSPAMLGIMNLRGQVVPVMDLGIHLGSGPADNDPNTRIVVLEENGETMGLRVSAVEDVANLTDSQIEPPDTARICQISNDLFRGVARVSAQPMILLDATQLLN